MYLILQNTLRCLCFATLIKFFASKMKWEAILLTIDDEWKRIPARNYFVFPEAIKFKQFPVKLNLPRLIFTTPLKTSMLL